MKGFGDSLNFAVENGVWVERFHEACILGSENWTIPFFLLLSPAACGHGSAPIFWFGAWAVKPFRFIPPCCLWFTAGSVGGGKLKSVVSVEPIFSRFPSTSVQIAGEHIDHAESWKESVCTFSTWLRCVGRCKQNWHYMIGFCNLCYSVCC